MAFSMGMTVRVDIADVAASVGVASSVGVAFIGYDC